ncbi:MAG TPA: GtrA family protein [Candidatus Saccharimonadales bacterium]|nr:GtrA family protein [Candidatus Saccharimonadales bacterium]
MKPIYILFGAADFRDLTHKVFVAKTRSGRIQFFRYLFVGGFSAAVNLAALFVLTSLMHIQYLVSEGLAFLIATIINYILSILWIFQRSNRFRLEFTLFTLVGVGGLGLNELVLWFCVSKIGLEYLVGEVFAIAVVMIWNFGLRKLMFTRLTELPSIRELD